MFTIKTRSAERMSNEWRNWGKKLQALLRAFRWVHSLRHPIFLPVSHWRGPRPFIKSRTKLIRNRNTLINKREFQEQVKSLWAKRKLYLQGGPSVASNVISKQEKYFYGSFTLKIVTKRPPAMLLARNVLNKRINLLVGLEWSGKANLF